jgi:acyl carrier protein
MRSKEDTVRLEEKTGLSFKEDDLKSLQTIQDVVDFIDERV